MDYVTRGQRSGKQRDPSLQQAVRAFSDVASALSDAPDTDHLLHLIADRMCELVGVDRCSLYLRDGKTGLFRGQVGRARADIDARVKRLVAGTYADQFTREILETRKTVLLTNARNDPRPIRSTMRDWRVSSMLGVPMVFQGEVIGLVYLDDEDGSATFSPIQQEIGSAFADLAAVVIAQAQSATDLRASLDESERKAAQLRRARIIDDRFERLLVAEADLPTLLREVSELTGKPAAIYDDAWRCRGLHRPDGAKQHPVPDLESPELHRHRAFRDGLADGARNRTRVVEPIPAAGLHQRLLVAPIGEPERPWGMLVVVESGSRLQTADAHVVRRAAINAAVQVLAERRVAASAAVSRQSLIADLLRGGHDAEGLRRTARAVGLDPSRPHVLCLLGDTAEGADARLPDPAGLAAAIPSAPDAETVLVADVEEGLLAIVAVDTRMDDRDAVDDAKARVDAGMRSLGLAGSVVAALSPACTDPQDYAEGYADARQVLTCMTQFAGDATPRVLAADDLGAGRVFVASSSRADAERFAHRALERLMGDHAGDRDLLATLQAFFECARSVRRSASLLGVHANTVRYRLARIEELTGLGVTGDARDQLTAELALLVLQLRGDCPWRASPEVGAPRSRDGGS